MNNLLAQCAKIYAHCTGKERDWQPGRRSSIIVFPSCLLLLITLLSATIILNAGPPGVSAAPDHVVLTWADDPRTTQTISWRTDVNTTGAVVRYAEVGVPGAVLSEKAQTISATGEDLSTNRGDVRLPSATMRGLKAETRYAYQVGSGDVWSEQRTFKTAPLKDTPLKVLVFGDSQSIHYDTWRRTLHAARQAQPDALFLINVGDLVDVGQDYAEWNAWFEAAAGVIDTIPIMPVPGNHESYTPYRNFSKPTYFTAQFKLPMNGPEELKGQAYSFDVGAVHFVMLDTQEGEQARFVPDMLERQRVWLEEDLRRSKQKWNLVFLHRPPYNNKPHEDNPNIRTAFVPIFDKYHVDVVFSGHDHVVARTHPLRSNMVVDSPEQGTVYVATGRSGSKTYRDVLAKEYNAFFFNPVEEPNYLTVQVLTNKLTVTVFTQSGAVIDTWEIDKGRRLKE